MRFALTTLTALASSSTRYTVASANSSSVFISASSASSFVQQRANLSAAAASASAMLVDAKYPGTALERLRNVHLRVAELAQTNALNGPWDEVRRKLLWAGGLRDLPNARPGQVRCNGYPSKSLCCCDTHNRHSASHFASRTLAGIHGTCIQRLESRRFDLHVGKYSGQ
jgi:hypothetical protein